MNAETLWSVRMHASTYVGDHAKHACGAERIVSDPDLGDTVAALLARAQRRDPDSIHLTTERIDNSTCVHVPCLGIRTVLTEHADSAAEFATEVLKMAGVASEVASKALASLHDGLGKENSSMRGASLWDTLTGDRLEKDTERGVRTTHFDFSQAGSDEIDQALMAAGLSHFRTREALAVATKTIWSGVVAELCWSDEPDYDTGYIATKSLGYLRLPHFKPKGAVGGRIFFVDRATHDVKDIIEKLQHYFVLIDPPITVAPTIDTTEFHFLA